MFVSIILPAYNTPVTILSRAIQSVLNQTYLYFELIIVDDGSIPSLEPIVKEFFDNRIIYVRHNENKGVGASHNSGINISKYNWIAFICLDDEWITKKLEIQMMTLELNSDNRYGLFYSNINYYIDGKIDDSKSNFAFFSGNIYETCLWKGFIHTSTILIKREVFDTIGLFDETGVLIDWDLYIRLSKYFWIYCINEKLVNYYYSCLGVTHHKSIL